MTALAMTALAESRPPDVEKLDVLTQGATQGAGEETEPDADRG